MIFALRCVISASVVSNVFLAEDQSGDGGDHARTHLHGVLGIIAKMIIRQQAPQHQTKQNSAEDAPGTD